MKIKGANMYEVPTTVPGMKQMLYNVSYYYY